MQDERLVAGLRCGAVLEQLEAYLADAISRELRAQIEEHLAGCERCERFGAAYAETVSGIRARLGAGEPIEPEVASRLLRRLAAERDA